MKRVVLIYKHENHSDRWFKGDNLIRKPIRRLVRGPEPVGGVDRVFLNLCHGFSQIGVNFITNPPMNEIRSSDWVGVIGRGRGSLNGYNVSNPIVTGVAVTAHPAEYPNLFDEFPVAFNVVHSSWVKDLFDNWYGPARVRIWAVGIDTTFWAPTRVGAEAVDFLVYDKIMWEPNRVRRTLRDPLLEELKRRNLTFDIVQYGRYSPSELKSRLSRARAFLFLSEHESQGLAYQQAMSMNVPVLAWDPGQWLDPLRFHYGESFVPATSVPLFDERCGTTFRTLLDFPNNLERFIESLNKGLFSPREFVLENLTLAECARDYLRILQNANQ